MQIDALAKYRWQHNVHSKMFKLQFWSTSIDYSRKVSSKIIEMVLNMGVLFKNTFYLSRADKWLILGLSAWVEHYGKESNDKGR